MRFIDEVKLGTATMDTFEHHVGKWEQGDQTEVPSAYLGVTRTEFALLCTVGTQEVIDAIKQNRDLGFAS